MYKLIADSGATKTDWAVSDPDGLRYFSTGGLNPHLLSEEEITRVLREEVIPEAKGMGLAEIFFYGSGCADPEMKEKMLNCFMEHMPVAGIHISTDLEAAGIALFGEKEGLACILGTGSSAGIYSGGLLIRQLTSSTFPEGDRGSGARIIYQLLKELANTEEKEIESALQDLTGKSVQQLLTMIEANKLDRRKAAALYKKTAPLHKREFFQGVIRNEIRAFTEMVKNESPEIAALPWGFIGSIALLNEHLIREICDEKDIRVQKILRKPIERLVKFHSP